MGGFKPFVYARLLDLNTQNTVDVYASIQMTRGVIPNVNPTNSRDLLTNTINSEALDLKRALFFQYIGQNLTTKKYNFKVTSSSPFVEQGVNIPSEVTTTDISNLESSSNYETAGKKSTAYISTSQNSSGGGQWLVGEPNTKNPISSSGKSQPNPKRVKQNQ